MKRKIRIACIGAGYFAQFHVEAWQRIPEVELVAICDTQIEKAQQLAQKFSVKKAVSDVEELLGQEPLDVIDIITPPETHYALCLQAAKRGIHIICQKPVAPTLLEAKQLVEQVAIHKVRLMIHENWRFKPWYRQIKQMLLDKAIGDKLHTMYFQMRMGDGWPEDAYLSRQPYFRTMPRLLVYETGIHFIDTFRYLAGEVESVFANLKKLNPAIAGEDAGQVFFNFKNGASAIWDANRFNESNHPNPRYTFGTMLVEGNGGSIRLYNDGRITLQQLGLSEVEVPYHHENRNFAGDCVYFLQKHFVHSYLNELPFETEGAAYLKNLEIQEAIYESSREKKLTIIYS
ncbi:MAG: Gfo/Idh/MocA family oxidoreductase [Bacteroidota bacterium]